MEYPISTRISEEAKKLLDEEVTKDSSSPAAVVRKIIYQHFGLIDNGSEKPS